MGRLGVLLVCAGCDVVFLGDRPPDAAAPDAALVDYCAADEFDDSTIDSNTWRLFDPQSAVSVTESGGVIRIALLANTDGAHYNGLVSTQAFDLHDAAARAELAAPPSTEGGCETYFELRTPDGSAAYVIDISGGMLFTIVERAGSEDRVFQPLDAALPHYRMRHERGSSELDFQRSPDGVGWENIRSVPIAIPLDALVPAIVGGTYRALGTPGTPAWEYVRVGRSSCPT